MGTRNKKQIPSLSYWSQDLPYEHTQSCLTLCTPWTGACQAALSMKFFRQEYWSVLPFSSSGESSPLRDRTCISWVSCIGRWFLHQLHHLGTFHCDCKPRRYIPHQLLGPGKATASLSLFFLTCKRTKTVTWAKLVQRLSDVSSEKKI